MNNERIREHHSGLHPESYTALRRPLVHVFTAEFQRPADAIDFEKRLKRWSYWKKSALARGDFVALKDCVRRQHANAAEKRLDC